MMDNVRVKQTLFPRAYSTSKFLLFPNMPAKRCRMLSRRVSIFAVILCVTSAFLSIANSTLAAPAQAAQGTEVLRTRFARLRHGINLSHWFAQSSTYSKEHLDTHTTAEDIALIKTTGFRSCAFYG